MPLSVALLTEPKPTAMIVIPSALRVPAVWIAPAEPPYWLFCSPSVRTTTTREYTLVDTPFNTWFIASSRPSLMWVPPLVGYWAEPYKLIAFSISERTALRVSITEPAELKNTTPAWEWPLAMFSWSSSVSANVFTPLL